MDITLSCTTFIELNHSTIKYVQQQSLVLILTQFALGSTVATPAVPARHQWAALLAGALVGTLPNLNTLLLMLIDNPVAIDP